MRMRSGWSLLVVAAAAACLGLPDAASAKRPAKREKPHPQHDASERHGQERPFEPPGRKKGPRELDPDPAPEVRRAGRPSGPALPAELQSGFEAWLRESLAAGLVDPRRALGIILLDRQLLGTLVIDQGWSFTAGQGVTLNALSASTAAVPAFSTTNLQEAGVDEADSIEFDGEFLYVAPGGSGPRLQTESEPGAAIRVLRASDDPAGAEPVGEIEVPGITAVLGMYLLGGPDAGDSRLVVLGAAPARAEPETPWENPWDWGWTRTAIYLFDVDDPTAPRELWSLVLEGELVATRRVGQTLHVVSRATPVLQRIDSCIGGELSELAARRCWLERGAAPKPLAEGALREARDRIEQASAGELLPQLAIDGGEPRPQVSPDRCLLGAANDPGAKRAPTLLTVTSLDLRRRERLGSLCIGGAPQQVYSSTGSLYLTFGSEGGTFVHKLAYTRRGPQYRGVGVVQGWVAGAQDGFSLGEHAGVLGVVTDRGARLPDPLPGDLGRYRLTLLREARGLPFVLEEVAHLPNEAEPEPIGKPGETIHGVRFLGERLYVVTYRKVDPLYAIDLRDPEFPRIAAQLEVPGFSDYLHPVGADLLLGVGLDTLPDVNNDWFQGIKVELFDVSDPSTLRSVGLIRVGRRGSTSPALGDHHAVSHLPAGPDGIHRFAVPIQVHDRTPLPGDGPSTFSPWLHTALHLFEVEEARSGVPAQLREVGAVVAAEADSGAPSLDAFTYGDHGDRSVLQGGAAHYVHQGRVWSAPWDAPEEVVGPR